MFKSVQWKLVLMFVLLVVAIMMVFGTIIKEQISTFYHNSFKNEMALAFSEELVFQIQSAANGEYAVLDLKHLLDTYSGRMGINSNRSYYILSMQTGATITGSDNNTSTPQKTENIIAAMAGKVGNTVSANVDYMDYALPVTTNNGGYIIYVYDTKAELLELTRSMLGIIAQALLIGIALSMILGFIMSKTITKPIVTLTKKAEGLARGRFDMKIDVKAKDEIGKLARTFNYMSAVIKDSMDEIDQEKMKLETVLRNMNDGVIAFDTDQNIMFINPEAKLMLNISDDAVESILFDEYFAQYGVDVSMAEMLYLEHFETICKELSVNGKYFQAFFAAFKTDTDKSDGVVVVIQDVTESRQLEISRREFVANVSHELRTPLTTIKGYAETLYEGTESEDEKRFLSVIVREVDRMTRIVKELLTLSSLDHNKLTIMKTTFKLETLVSEIVARMSINASEKNIKLTYAAAIQAPELYADIDRLEQVIINIISNAIKYTGEGGQVEVFTGYVYNEAYIKVRDNGIGIPEADLPRVFERFYRVDKARSRENGGTGLGLSIAYELVKLHGGTIKINSEYHVGTEVIVKLPITSPPDQTAVQPQSEASGRR